MSTPPNRPQVQRPTLEDCRIVENHLRRDAIEAAGTGHQAAVSNALWRYSVLVLLDAVSKADCDALYHHCRELAAQAKQEAA